MTVVQVQPKEDILFQYFLDGKTHKKKSVSWRLLMVIIVGFCGLSLCFVRVGRRTLLKEAGLYGKDPVSHFHCPNILNNASNSIQLHYPRPKSYQRGECICTPVHFFVILSMQRSGSGWFETLLNDHPNISSHGEIFHRGSMQERNLNFIKRRIGEVYNLDYNSSAAKNVCTSAVGFKWMLNQGALEYHKEIISYFRKRGVSVIFLLRRNLLRRLVSILANAYDREAKLINGTHKSHVHSKQEAAELAAFKPTIKEDTLVDSFRKAVELSQNALKLFHGTRHIVIYYEDLVKNKKVCFRFITDILIFLLMLPENLLVTERSFESSSAKPCKDDHPLYYL
ncbi:hypothetical protein KP509_23G030800 [Ceratopteris richardii]|uniref:Sulfotransferase n=1 Tax=Ceratopteris richardii TaxID=49495 RepID=A0A8T2RY72_CERRI|nr:hypothetical protein KP509_23G030800 [Ceratopteris richardii]